MRHTREQPSQALLLPLLLLISLLLAGCQSEEEKVQSDLEAKVMATLENTPEHLAVEVLRTCDKWRRVDPGRECIEAEARRDQFHCWLARGYPKLEHGYQYKLRQRTRDHTTLLKQDHCMELRRWKLIEGRRKTYDHIFGTRPGNAAPSP